MTAFLAASANATDFPVGEGSTAQMDGQMSVSFVGTLLGDWDEETYPEGTLTLPGVWGGSGNHEIPLEFTLTIPITLEGQIAGSMSIDIETAPGVCVVQNLDWDLLGGGEASAALTASLLYETFHTEQPDSLYIGGFPIDLPLGEAPITEALFQQVATGAGTSSEVPGAPGVFEIDVVVPGLSSMTVLILDTPYPLQLPASLVLSGTYAFTDDGEEVDLTASFEVDESSDLPDEPLPPIPFELPTIIPPGDVAGVYLNLTPTSTDISATLDASVNGHVDDDDVPGDVNGDGIVDTNDILAILSAWGPCTDCPEDLDGDGVVGVNEILLVIEHWG